MKYVVVGAGLAGLAVSLALTNDADCEVDILEKRDNLDSEGATFGLAPNGSIALFEICKDVLKSLRPIGIQIPESPGALMLPWAEMRNALLREVRTRDDRIRIHLGVTVSTVLHHTDHVTVTLDDSTGFQADVLIGADGVYSFVREHVVKLEPFPACGVTTWRGKISLDNDKNHNSTEEDMAFVKKFIESLPITSVHKFGRTIIAFFNFHQTVPYTVAWTVVSKTTEREMTPLELLDEAFEEDDWDQEQLATSRRVLKIVPPEELTFCTELNCVDLTRTSDFWRGVGRVTLIGDAAHAMRPASGQGGAMAFEDAALLARMLKQCTNGQTDISETLRAFEKARKPRLASLIEDQHRRSEAAYKKGKMPDWSKEYREWVFSGHDAAAEIPKRYDDSD